MNSPKENQKTEDKQVKLKNALLSPAFLTAIITLFGAPIATGFINSQIAQKNIQTEILKSVIATTESSGIDKLESIQRLHIIASMIDENKDFLDIKLDSTLNMINSEVVDGTMKLKNNLSVTEENLDRFRDRAKNDSILLVNSNSQLQKLNEQRQHLLRTDHSNRKEIKRLDIAIRDQENLVAALKEKERSNKLRLAELQLEYDNIRNEYNKSKMELKRMVVVKDSLNKKSEEVEKLLKNTQASRDEIDKTLKKVQYELNKSSQTIEDLKVRISQLTNDNEMLAAENNRLRQKNDDLIFHNRTYARVPEMNLDVGSSGEEVKKLQEALIRLQYIKTADSQYGEATKKGVEKFQLDHGLDTTGIFGRFENKTRNMILAQLKSLTAASSAIK